MLINLLIAHGVGTLLSFILLHIFFYLDFAVSFGSETDLSRRILNSIFVAAGIMIWAASWEITWTMVGFAYLLDYLDERSRTCQNK